jgi:hypothetical protein
MNKMIKTLNLYKVWNLMNRLSDEMNKLSEDNIYVSLLGYSSEYFKTDYDNFLEYYSFRIEDNNIIVYNNDGVPYEDYNNNDFSYLDIKLLELDEQGLTNWIKSEVENQLEQQEKEKIMHKEKIKNEIERLKKQLDEDV